MGAKHRKNRSPQNSLDKRKPQQEDVHESGVSKLGHVVAIIMGIIVILALLLLVYGDELTQSFKKNSVSSGEAVYDSKTGKSKLKEDKELIATEVASYPHDKKAFTQGLVLLNGYLYESTGMYGESEFRKVDIETGKVLKSYKLPDKYFGEGLTYVSETERFYQLTWREGVMFEFDKDMNLIKEYTNLPATKTKELWGICNNGTHFFVTDGSHYVYVWTMTEPIKVLSRIAVFDTKARAVNRLNEVECISKPGTYPDVFANVWYSDTIHLIDLVTANVKKSYDMSALHKRKNQHDVLNGIAVNDDLSTMYITGKLWPTMHEFSMKEKK